MNPALNQAPQLLTAPQAAKALAISEKTLWTLSAPRGGIPVVRVGKRGVRYRPESLNTWIESQQRTAAVL